ncbi:hypothetical protein DH2020_030456 [Rehmannia glutinosa]|uniref:Prephenate/arogenate dehydrogenase domain-containing protein n=1 Tax=Rehmannia glutinosa TaxID=99300 RepID=A0ABR0VNJ2_REHGL
MSSPSDNSLKIGIIGFGPFAQFLVKTMIKQGHFIRATSRSDYTDLCNQLGISFFRDMNGFFESDNDVILMCTSILSLSQVIKSLPLDCLKQPALFVDVLSVKEYPRDLMLQVLPQDSDVLCTHPMFGPESGRDGWNDLSFMFDKVRITNETICSRFLQIFASEVGQKFMFLDQQVLAEMEIQPTPIDTKGFQKLIEVSATISMLTKDYTQKESTSRDSFDLFSGLFIHNRFAKQQVWFGSTCIILYLLGFTNLINTNNTQLRNLELAFETIKEQLIKRMNEELDPS